MTTRFITISLLTLLYLRLEVGSHEIFTTQFILLAELCFLIFFFIMQFVDGRSVLSFSPFLPRAHRDDIIILWYIKTVYYYYYLLSKQSPNRLVLILILDICINASNAAIYRRHVHFLFSVLNSYAKIYRNRTIITLSPNYTQLDVCRLCNTGITNSIDLWTFTRTTLQNVPLQPTLEPNHHWTSLQWFPSYLLLHS